MPKNLLKIILVAGARPNFMKVAPVLARMKKYPQPKVKQGTIPEFWDDKVSERVVGIF